MKKLLFAFFFACPLALQAQFFEGTLHLKDGSSRTGLIELNYDNGANFKPTEDADYEAIPIKYLKAADIVMGDETDHYLYMDAGFNLIASKEEETVKRRLFRLVSENPKLTVLSYTPSRASLLLVMADIEVLYLLKKDADTPVAFTYYMEPSLTGYQRSNFKEFAMEFFADCPSLVEKIHRKKFKAKHSLEVIEYYNNNCN